MPDYFYTILQCVTNVVADALSRLSIHETYPRDDQGKEVEVICDVQVASICSKACASLENLIDATNNDELLCLVKK